MNFLFNNMIFYSSSYLNQKNKESNIHTIISYSRHLKIHHYYKVPNISVREIIPKINGILKIRRKFANIVGNLWCHKEN